jgi:hypothetical protein
LLVFYNLLKQSDIRNSFRPNPAAEYLCHVAIGPR